MPRRVQKKPAPDNLEALQAKLDSLKPGEREQLLHQMLMAGGGAVLHEPSVEPVAQAPDPIKRSPQPLDALQTCVALSQAMGTISQLIHMLSHLASFKSDGQVDLKDAAGNATEMWTALARGQIKLFKTATEDQWQSP